MKLSHANNCALDHLLNKYDLHDAWEYFVTFNFSPHRTMYHGFTHAHMFMEMLDIYIDKHRNVLSRNTQRELMLAGMMHDANHYVALFNPHNKGYTDQENIDAAMDFVMNFKYYMGKLNKIRYLGLDYKRIKELISYTKFPYEDSSDDEFVLIMRDCDNSMCFSDYYPSLVLNLAYNENGIKDLNEIIKQTIIYLENRKFHFSIFKDNYERNSSRIIGLTLKHINNIDINNLPQYSINNKKYSIF